MTTRGRNARDATLGGLDRAFAAADYRAQATQRIDKVFVPAIDG